MTAAVPPEIDGSGAATAADAAHVVEFTLGEETCAIDVDAVDSIVEMTQITRIPRAPAAVDGVMDLRGETTAVVDPREFLSVAGESADQNILVLDRPADKQKIGIRVDEVTEVSTYPEDAVDRDHLERLATDAIEARIVNGVLRRETEAGVRLALWLDVDRLIAAVTGNQP